MFHVKQHRTSEPSGRRNSKLPCIVCPGMYFLDDGCIAPQCFGQLCGRCPSMQHCLENRRMVN